MPDNRFFTDKYRALYRAMIYKDGAALNSLLAETFYLVHITGMRQSKQEFISAVINGTLNYFSEELREANTLIQGDCVQFIGKSLVNAAVFGGGRHTWRLQLDTKFAELGGDWFITEAVASTW